MKNRIFFFLLLIICCTCNNVDTVTPQAEVVPPAKLTFELFGEYERGIGNLPIYLVSSDKLCKLNLRIGSDSPASNLMDILSKQHPSLSSNRLLSILHFGLQKNIKIRIAEKYELESSFYHAEPQTIGQDGQRLLFFFDTNDLRIDLSQPTDAQVIIKHGLFGTSEILLPLILQPENLLSNAPQ